MHLALSTDVFLWTGDVQQDDDEEELKIPII